MRGNRRPDRRRSAGTWGPAIALLALTLVAGTPAHAGYEDLPWTTGVGRVTVETITPQQAREEALALARRDAVAQVAGLQIDSSTDRVQIEAGDQMMDRFRQINSARTHGHIVEEEILACKPELVDDLMQMVCTIRARVAVENRRPDPSFKLRADLVGPESRVFRSGEQLILELEATKDCYVTVFNVATDGTYSVLIPSERLPDNRLAGGRTAEFPSEKERRHSPIRVYADPERDTTEEYFYVVATLEPHPFLSNEKTDLGHNLAATAKADPAAFSRWLLDISPERRTSAEVFYSIVP